MMSDLAAFPMLGVALRIWHVDLSPPSLFIVAESGGVRRCCVKILGGVYL
jgi:hypothetical protein